MKKIVFLTGAGMSVESGFKTFRGNDGLWENYPVEQVATHEGWEKDPTLVTNFYNMLRDKLWDAQPNEGHRLIKELEKDYEVCVVTQNVDNLHEKAGSSNVIHLHGELTKVCSSNDPYNNTYTGGHVHAAAGGQQLHVDAGNGAGADQRRIHVALQPLAFLRVGDGELNDRPPGNAEGLIHGGHLLLVQIRADDRPALVHGEGRR